MSYAARLVSFGVIDVPRRGQSVSADHHLRLRVLARSRFHPHRFLRSSSRLPMLLAPRAFAWSCVNPTLRGIQTRVKVSDETKRSPIRREQDSFQEMTLECRLVSTAL